MDRVVGKLLFSVVCSAIMLSSCAQQGNPGGGEGDVTPPQFFSVRPENRSTSVSVDQKITLTFNEWVEPASAKKAITIHPTIKGGFKISVEAKKVEITPNDSFASNTTYHISINSELTDFYRNRLKEPVNCVFSTGASIDSGTITGGVTIENDNEKVPLKAALFIGARLDQGLDTVLLAEPDYLVQCDSLHRFTFENINENNYALLAFRDKNSDNRLTPGETAYVTKSNRVSTASASAIILTRTISDTAQWKIAKVVQVAPTILSAAISPARVPDSATVVSVDGKTRISIKQKQILSDSATILMTLEKELPSGLYDLISSWPNRFTAGKALIKNDSLPYRAILSDTVRFNAVLASDSIKPKLVSWKFIGPAKKMPMLKLSWSLPVNFSATLELSDSTGNKYPLTLAQSPELNLLFMPKKELPANQKLALTLKPDQFSSLTKKGVTITDSVVSIKTVEEKDIALSLLLAYPSCHLFRGWQWELRPTNGQDTLPIPLAQVSDGLLAEQIPAGTYTVSLFEDRNSNKTQDRGTLFPRVVGEPRIFLPDTVKAKARWRTELALESSCELLTAAKVVKPDSAATKKPSMPKK